MVTTSGDGKKLRGGDKLVACEYRAGSFNPIACNGPIILYPTIYKTQEEYQLNE